MSLLAAFLAITADWDAVFPQQRTFRRAVRQALGSLVCLGRRCLSRIIWTNGGQDRSWSAEYFLHSRCQWEPQELFRPILKQALEHGPQRLVGVAIDDTKLRKTGRCISQAFYQRDPLSPPFHVNLVLGLRFLQASLLVPLHRNAPVGSRALPIRFQEVSRVMRARKDAKLCFRAIASAPGPRRFYGTEKFTPESVRQDQSREWKTTRIFYGGKRRKIRYKEVTEVYWQRGAKQRPLRLIVIAPTLYRKSKSKKMYYRDPAYLLTTDLRSSTKQLLQIYFDRWQIEVNHREEKDTLGVGQAQLWNVISVPKQPVLAVAAYSALLLASPQAFGAERGAAYAELPKWRRSARRPSCFGSDYAPSQGNGAATCIARAPRLTSNRFRLGPGGCCMRKCRNSSPTAIAVG